MDTVDDVEGLATDVTHLAQTLEGLLEYGKQVAKDSVSDFVNEKIGKLFGMATAYEKCFESLGVPTKSEMEKKIHKHARHAKLREASTELLNVEQEWDIFLGSIDKTLEGDSSDTVQLGETGPLHAPLVDARTSQQTSLQDFLTGSHSLVLILLRHFA